MNVRDLMRSEVRTCTAEMSLAEAGKLMAEIGCGVLPVMSTDGKLVGMITDRDICVDVATRDLKPSEIPVARSMTATVHSCAPKQHIREALAVMRKHRVRRLPVVENDRLAGILSLDDVVLKARGVETEVFTGPIYADIALTLKAICEEPLPALVS